MNDHSNSIVTISSNISLAWRNIRYAVNTKPWKIGNRSCHKKLLLRGLTGHIERRSLNGFMGPSGSGKTTLLNCLNGTINQLVSDSEIYVNQQTNEPQLAFIEQHVHETIFGGFTIRNILQYAFRFKNQLTDSHSDMNDHIMKTLKDLLLDPQILDRPFDQCSGGEQKRIAIAQELMSLKKPTFLFIDEPTTGLDSQAALLVMQCLRRITSEYEISIIVSIHMPNSDIINLFDSLYILAKGGVCIYAGTPNMLQENLQTVLDRQIEQEKPPIEEYLKMASKGHQDCDVQTLAKHTIQQENEKLRNKTGQLCYLPKGLPRSSKPFCVKDFYVQMIRLSHLIWFVQFRSMMYQVVSLLVYLIYMSTVFDHRMVSDSNQCYSRQNNNVTCKEYSERTSNSYNYLSYLGHVTTFISYINIICSLILFVPILNIFQYEHRNRWYSMSTFFFSLVIIKFMEVSFLSLIITCLCYFPVEMYLLDNLTMNWRRFGYYAFFLWLLCLYIQSIGQLISVVLLKQMALGVMMAPIIMHTIAMNSNMLVRLKHMGRPYLIFGSDLVATKFIINGLLYAFFDLDICDPETQFNEQEERGMFRRGGYVFSELTRPIINIIVLRLLTYVLMYVKFNMFHNNNSQMIISQEKSLPKSKLYEEWKTALMIDDNGQELSTADNPNKVSFCPSSPPGNQNGSNENDCGNTKTEKNMQLIKMHRLKSVNELQFEEFTRDKVIIGWRTLSLFGSSSIYEIHPTSKSYDGNQPNQDKRILRDLNGQFKFGTLNALMGTSGAGKTSFLKVLNGRLKTQLCNETKIYLSRYTPIRICYLTQEVSGHLWPGLTVKQSLIYASKLKNTQEHELGVMINHENIALSLMEELDILDAANTMTQNCSGGEKKRLALAQELTSVRMPNFICIDEPTSGLDSFSAEILVKCLGKFVKEHMITIVASIHQPTTEMLMLFDYCYVLARGGVCIYSDIPSRIDQHLSDIEEINWTTKNQDGPHKKFPLEELIKWSCEDYKHPVVKKMAWLTKQKIHSYDEQVMEETQNVDCFNSNRTRFSMQSVIFLMERHWQYVLSYQWMIQMGFYMWYLVMGLLNLFYFNSTIAKESGCVSYDEDFVNTCNLTEEEHYKQDDLVSNVEYNYTCLIFIQMIVVLHSGLTFSLQSIPFLNEHINGWYSTGAYYLCMSVFEMIPVIPVVVIYTYIIDIYEPYLGHSIFWWLFFIHLIGTFISQSVGYMLAFLNTSVGSSAQQTSWMMASLFLNSGVILYIVAMLCNFFNPIHTMHYFYQMLSYLVPYRFQNEASLLLQYGFDRCGHREINVVLYHMNIMHDQYFAYCLQLQFLNFLFYRLVALLMMIMKANPEWGSRRKRLERVKKYHNNNLQTPLNTIIPGLTICDSKLFIKKIEI